MATVPTLTIGGTDQTDFIQSKSFDVKLKTLDVTLVDPVTNPALHNVVSVDDPEWHGRVSTIESTPYRVHGGADHRWVKITCTNKHTAAADTAPFGLSDEPDYATTFPYKDFTYIQTLADQTDLATAEHRATAIVYEPGLVPGMTVEITNDAEGLTATEFIISEITVDWLRSDAPEYRLEMSVEGVPPVTLGDVIASQGCDCPPFECEEVDYHVYTDLPSPSMACIVDDDIDPEGCDSSHALGDTMRLYAGATYRVDYTVFHAPASRGVMRARLESITFGMGESIHDDSMADMGAVEDDNDIPLASVTFAVDETCDAVAQLDCNPPVASDNEGSSISAQVVYLSGSDPRFETLGPCADVPSPGQPIAPESHTGDGSTDSFTTTYPYMPGSLEVIVEGVDWSDQVIEDDATAGDWSLAYPPPEPTDPEPNFEVYYRFPK